MLKLLLCYNDFITISVVKSNGKDKVMNHTEQQICDYLKSHDDEVLDVDCMSCLGISAERFDKAIDSLEHI